VIHSIAECMVIKSQVRIAHIRERDMRQARQHLSNKTMCSILPGSCMHILNFNHAAMVPAANVVMQHHHHIMCCQVRCCVCLQAQGRPVVAAQVDVGATSAEKRRLIEDSVTYNLSEEDERAAQATAQERLRIQTLLSSGALDVSKARILQLGAVQVPPQKGVLWLEQKDVTDEWVELSPGLVVLGARKSQVGAQAHLGCKFGVATR
jgi:hypothetical protein